MKYKDELKTIICEECNDEIEQVVNTPHLDYDGSTLIVGDSKHTIFATLKFREEGQTYFSIKGFCTEECKTIWLDEWKKGNRKIE